MIRIDDDRYRKNLTWLLEQPWIDSAGPVPCSWPHYGDSTGMSQERRADRRPPVTAADSFRCRRGFLINLLWAARLVPAERLLGGGWRS